MFCNNARCSLVKGFLVGLKNYLNKIRTCDNFYDNTGALAVAKDLKYHGKASHIKKKYHYIRDIIIEKDVVLKHISTSNMVVDPLTKPIARDIFVKHVRSLGLCRM